MEFFRLLWLNIKVSGKNFIEFLRTVKRYYPTSAFRRVDLSLLALYFFKNPFRISKRFLVEQGAEDPYAYGETPLTSMDLIAKECGIAAHDYVYELGCGRGRTCFWLNAFVGCRVVGIDFVPFFIEAARKTKGRYAVQGVDFILGDMLECGLAQGTVVYLYGTCYDDAFIHALIKKFEAMPKGTRIITVSYSLDEFGTDKFFVKRCFPVPFTWGVGDVYLQVRK